MGFKKVIKKTITGVRVYLRPLTVKDVSLEYLQWMKDKRVTDFLEERKDNTTFEGLRKYVKSVINDKNNYFFGIFFKENNKHIGNVKIGGVHKVHKYADIGILIGDKKVWGKGLGTEAIELTTKYAFEVLHLHKLFAGINELNISSYRAFIKAGYKDAGRFKSHLYYKGKFVDGILVEKINKNET